MTSKDDFGYSYLRLTLEINKHIEGYLDSYFGPLDIKANVDRGRLRSPQELLDDVVRLRELVPEGESTRQAFLKAQLRSIETTIRTLNGEQFDYLDEIERLYDFRPQPIEEKQFDIARNELDTVLPGSGGVGKRLQMWREQFQIPKDKLLIALEFARDETRKRTREFVTLAAAEHIEISLTSNVPWDAYNRYKGSARSEILFNVDTPHSALDLAELFSHEAYPGHHTEFALKEQHLYREKGRLEQASLVLVSPAAVQSEGVAMTAVEIIFPSGSQYEWTAEVLLPMLGLPSVPAEQIRCINEVCKHKLFYTSGVTFYAVESAAIKFHTGAITEEEVVEYIRVNGLVSEARARQALGFLADPLFRTYIPCYTAGYRLIGQATHGGDKKSLFRRLLVENVLPSELEKM